VGEAAKHAAVSGVVTTGLSAASQTAPLPDLNGGEAALIVAGEAIWTDVAVQFLADLSGELKTSDQDKEIIHDKEQQRKELIREDVDAP